MCDIKNISLFIPYVFSNFSKKYVADAFSEIGDVESVDFVAKQDRNGKVFNAAYVHFNTWYTNDCAFKIQNKLTENGSTKFYHDESEYYWIVLPNTAKKHVPGERKQRIDLGESNSIGIKYDEKTPKKVREIVCPAAPQKLTYSQIISNTEEIIPKVLYNEFEEWDAEASEEAAQMAEIDAELDIIDQNLVSIDCRYIRTIEEENHYMHNENYQLHLEIEQLRTAIINLDKMYQAEKAKVTALNNMDCNV